MIKSVFLFLLSSAYVVLAPAGGHAAELVMFDSPACSYCEMWDTDIADIYPKTEEGHLAPLRRVSIHDPLPSDLSGLRGIVYTPTFILVDEGREVGRISGYPGEDFFWGFLETLVAKLPKRS